MQDHDLERRVDALEAGHAVVAAAVSRIGGEARTLAGRTAALTEDQSRLRVQVARIEERCSDVRAGLSGLSQSIADVGDKVVSVSTRLNELDKDWRRIAIATLAPAVVAIALGLWSLLVN
jgi:uncharacterized protein YoxC